MQSSASCQMATACREAPCTAANKIPEYKTGAHHDVPGRLARLHGELIAHDGFGEIRVEIRILRKDQKEVTCIAASNIALSSTTVTASLCGMLRQDGRAVFVQTTCHWVPIATCCSCCNARP